MPPTSARTLVLVLAASAAIVLAPRPLGAQEPAVPSAERIAEAIANAARTAHTSDPPAPLVFANRKVVEFRATVLSRPPAARATVAGNLLTHLVDTEPRARVTTRDYGEAIVLRIGDHPVFAVFSADVDVLAGEQLAAKAADTASRLQTAFDEAVELHNPGRLLRAGAIALAATIVCGALLWLVIRIDRRVAARLARKAEEQLRRLPGAEGLVPVADTRTAVHLAFTIISFVLGALLCYSWLTIVLRRFPYTRPWGESLRGGLFSTAGSAGRSFVDALPNLVTVLAVVLITRILVRLATAAFQAVERGRLTLPGLHPDTAQPTRRIMVALLWVCALIVSYPYLPGSQSDVFKGVSVFVGLIVSLGSTGVMNQLMSGIMVTYSRALRCGDFVRVANIEGTVTALGALATKITTPRNEEITIPNAIVVSHATTNYSRNAEEGVFASTAVTIGYDTPWRQVHALLLQAAQRTPGIRAEPKPIILQTALEDFYVQYTLFAALEQPHRRFFVLDRLHANIQDAFNEYGVQIMSPRYVADPAGAKVVPPHRWHSAPAPAPAAAGAAEPTGSVSAQGEPLHTM